MTEDEIIIKLKEYSIKFEKEHGEVGIKKIRDGIYHLNGFYFGEGMRKQIEEQLKKELELWQNTERNQ